MKKGILVFVVSVFVLSFVSCGKTNKICGNESKGHENEVKAKEAKEAKEAADNKEFEALKEKAASYTEFQKWFKEKYGDIAKDKMSKDQKEQSDYIETVKAKEQKK